MEYFECPVLQTLTRKEVPIETVVPTDQFTDMVQANFDYDFAGKSKFYPYTPPIWIIWIIKYLLSQGQVVKAKAQC